MASFTSTVAKRTEFAGDYKLVCLTGTLTTASDATTLTAAAHGISEITAIVGAVITGGMDAAFLAIQVSYSGLVITVVSKGEAGSAATDWTGTTVALSILGK